MANWGAAKALIAEKQQGRVVELVNTADLKSAGVSPAGSSPAPATIDTRMSLSKALSDSWMIRVVKAANKTLRGFFYPQQGQSVLDAWRHPLDTMPMERYKQLSLDITGGMLTSSELAEGYRFCCEWDGMLVHGTHPEANCCSCLKEYRAANKIADVPYPF